MSNLNIYLRHSSSALEDLTFDAEAANQFKFHTIKIKKNEFTDRVGGRLLGGRAYSHKKYSFSTFELVISADQFTLNDGNDTNRLNLLKDFWKATFQYISVEPYEDYIQVLPVAGAFPINYLEEIEYLKEVTFQFESVEVS